MSGPAEQTSKTPATWRPMAAWSSAILLVALLAVALAVHLCRREDRTPVQAGRLAAEVGICLPAVRACRVGERVLSDRYVVVVTVDAEGALRLDGRVTDSSALGVCLLDIASGHISTVTVLPFF